MRRTALFFTVFFWLQAAFGAPEACRYPWLFPPAKSLPEYGPTQAWGVRLQADEKRVMLKGPVEILSPRHRMSAEHAEWLRPPVDEMHAQGDVRLQTPELLIKGATLTYQRKTRLTTGEHLRFQSLDRQYRGQAKTLRDDRASRITRMQNAVITTCPLGRDDWLLHARNLWLDRKAQRIYARHAWLTIADIPVFYTPYISYPTSRRGSGFLVPRLESYKSPNRTDSSWLIGIPYYFNLAPNYDDTLTVYHIQDRGTLIDNEFRLLTHQGQGTFLGSFIQDEAYDSNRWRWQLKGDYRLTRSLIATADWAQTSDRDFFADLPLETALKTEPQRQRTVRLSWQPQPAFSAYLLHQDYLLLRNHGYNYERRPEMGLLWQKKLATAVDLRLDTTSTDFEIPIAGHGKPEGWRHRVLPELHGAWSREWGSYGFTARVQHNRYTLNDSRTPTFTVPMAEVHGQLIFERPATEWGARWKQTLEPKVQLTWVPRIDEQLNAPNFDSGTRSLSFDNLFTLNRFTGGDRVGDTNRLSVALTSRLLTPKGKERVRLALGQAFYLTPRHIGLTGLQSDTTPASDYFLLGRFTHQRLLLDTTLQLRRHDLSLSNLVGRWRLMGDSWRWLGQLKWEQAGTANESKSLLTGAHAKLGHGWTLGTFWELDLQQDRTVEQLHSIGYESCCWRSEIQLEETRLEDGRYNYAIRFVLTLKELGTGGRRFDAQLNDKLNF